MDLQEARQLLGLAEEPPTLEVLRRARNSALKAHHPDLVGADEAAKRRATYWSAQINKAYATLAATIGTEQRGEPSPADPQRQSFAAAARRATGRASSAEQAEATRAAERRKREADVARAARARAQQQAAEEKAAQAARVRASEQKAAQAHAARQAQAEAATPASTDPATKVDKRPVLSRSAGRPMVARVAQVAASNRVAVAAFTLIFSGIAIAALASALPPSPTSAAIASASPASTLTAVRATQSPGPTPQPTDPLAKTSFDYWVSSYRTSILPCYVDGACSLDATVEYSDGSKAKLASEIERLGILYRDNFTLWMDGNPLCRSQFASLYALFASTAAEINLTELTTMADSVPSQWRPTLSVAYVDCGTASDTGRDRAAALRTSLGAARAAASRAITALRAKDWNAAQSLGQQLSALGIDIARSSGGDLVASDPWQDARAVAWTTLDISGLLEVRRLAAAPSTLSGLNDLTAAIDAVTGKLP